MACHRSGLSHRGACACRTHYCPQPSRAAQREATAWRPCSARVSVGGLMRPARCRALRAKRDSRARRRCCMSRERARPGPSSRPPRRRCGAWPMRTACTSRRTALTTTGTGCTPPCGPVRGRGCAQGRGGCRAALLRVGMQGRTHARGDVCRPGRCAGRASCWAPDHAPVITCMHGMSARLFGPVPVSVRRRLAFRAFRCGGSGRSAALLFGGTGGPSPPLKSAAEPRGTP
jgi:hypothetical protein